jgi:ribonuclease E
MAGVVYAAGVKHAYNLADAFNEFGIKAKAVSGETPKRELSRTLADYEAGKIDVLINAQLLAEGWNSPRATVCLHLAPTASKRIYQQRVGRVTRREPGKEAGLVVDFVHPATKHDDPVVTLHSLLERDVYRGGAIVVGPVRRGRGRKVRVERRVLPVASDEAIRVDIFKRELWRIAVEYLDYGEQVQWAALAGASVSSANWRKARAMLHFDRGGELKRAFLVTAIKRNPSQAVKLKAVQDIAALRDPDAFADAVDEVVGWNKADRRDAVRVLLQSIADKPVGRRDQATAWIWQLAEATADEHEEYATQRWKDGKRLLGLLVNSAGPAHGRNARRLVQATREQDRRLQSAMLAAARPHTPESQQVITGARTRLARKPGALARELLRNIPKAGSPTGGGPPESVKAKKRGGQDANGAVEPIDTGDAISVVGASANASADGAKANGNATAIDGNETTNGTATSDGAVVPKKSGITRHVITDDLDAWTFESEAAEHAAEHGEGGGGGKKSRRNRGRNRGRNKRGGAATGGGQPQGKANGKNGSAKGEAKGNGQAKGNRQAKANGQQNANGQATANGSADASANASGEGSPTTRRRNRGRSRRNRGEQNSAEGAVATASANGSGNDSGGNGGPQADSVSSPVSNASDASANRSNGGDGPANGSNGGGGKKTDRSKANSFNRNAGSAKPEDPKVVTSSIAAAAAALMGGAPKPQAAKPATATTDAKPRAPRAPRKPAAKATASEAAPATKTATTRKPAAKATTAKATAAKPAAAKTTAANPATAKATAAKPTAAKATATRATTAKATAVKPATKATASKAAAATKPAAATKTTAVKKPAARKAPAATAAAAKPKTPRVRKAPAAKPATPKPPASGTDA